MPISTLLFAHYEVVNQGAVDRCIATLNELEVEAISWREVRQLWEIRNEARHGKEDKEAQYARQSEQAAAR